MRAQVADPPRDFVAINARVFAGLGVSRVRLSAGRLEDREVRRHAQGADHRALRARRASARCAGRARVHLVKRRGRWRVHWTPATIDPRARGRRHASSSAATGRRAHRSSAPAAPSSRSRTNRWSSASSASGSSSPRRCAPTCSPPARRRAQVRAALAAAKQHPTYFEPIYTITQARFDQLKAAAGAGQRLQRPGHPVRGLDADRRDHPAADRASGRHRRADHRRAAQAARRPPTTPRASVGQTGIEASEETTLAGTPTTHDRHRQCGRGRCWRGWRASRARTAPR